MKPRAPEPIPQEDLFCSRLENLISPRHPLVLLARRIDWEGLKTEFGAFYEDVVAVFVNIVVRFFMRLARSGKALHGTHWRDSAQALDSAPSG